MKFDSIRFVLVASTHPGNIGAAARAMKTMGFTRLYLVSPKYWPDGRAYEMASGADDVLREAVVTDSLFESIKDCQLVLGTSARSRDIALPGLTPTTNAHLIAEQPDDTQVAVVFGREHAGLTNEELLHCHHQITIPSDPEYRSLNLAQAVQIIAYELRKPLLLPKAIVNRDGESLATLEEVERFYTHLQEMLLEIDFLKPSNPKRLMQRLRRLFNRIKLEHKEINILRGILTQVQHALKQARSFDD